MQQAWSKSHIKAVLFIAIFGAWGGATSFPDIIAILKAIFSIVKFSVFSFDFSTFSKASIKTMESLNMNMAELIVLVAVFIALLLYCAAMTILGIVKHGIESYYFPTIQERKDIAQIKRRLKTLERKARAKKKVDENKK